MAGRTGEPPESGWYHAQLARYASHPLHQWYLARAYADGHAALLQTGPDPLAPASGSERDVLLCGTGSADTTEAFVGFVRARNARARVVVVDISDAPLAASRERISDAGTTFVRADARALPFEDASFDLIETDFFLQYFDQDGKHRLTAEWRRVLKGSGAIMTRDYVPTWTGRARTIESGLDRLRCALLARTLRQRMFRSSGEEIRAIFGAHGLRTTITAARLPHMPSVPLVKHVTARPVLA